MCELSCLVSRGTGLSRVPSGAGDEASIAEAVSAAIAAALEEAGMWEGDVGVVFLAAGTGAGDPVSGVAERALSAFSQLPTISLYDVLGETFAARFPFECAGAALVLSKGSMPPSPRLERVQDGVEFWVEKPSLSLLGNAALVVGWSFHSVVAVIFKGI